MSAVISPRQILVLIALGIYIFVCPALRIIRLPVDGDTTVKFACFLTFCQCGDTQLFLAAVKKNIRHGIWNPLGRAVGFSQSYCCNKRMTSTIHANFKVFVLFKSTKCLSNNAQTNKIAFHRRQNVCI